MNEYQTISTELAEQIRKVRSQADALTVSLTTALIIRLTNALESAVTTLQVQAETFGDFMPEEIERLNSQFDIVAEGKRYIEQVTK